MSDRAEELQIPEGLTNGEAAYPLVFVDTEGMDLLRCEEDQQGQVDAALAAALERVHGGAVTGQALLKVHIGEPKCVTRMRPAHARSSVRFLRRHGADSVAAGDTTVAYTGPRGDAENPEGDCSTYLALARKHGWAEDGEAGVPFVVLDRPSTAREDALAFQEAEVCRQVGGVRRFRDFYLAGGFHAADFVVNHAHLTLHGLAGLAGCVKSLAMGCSSLTGKLRMHQHLFPEFDAAQCTLCGRCVAECPEAALSLPEGAQRPVLDRERCIGCGQCVSVCATCEGAASLHGEAIGDWQRGSRTLGMRMTDYVVGLMNGRWNRCIHVLHVYAVTALCDCVDTRQERLLQRDLGFLVGKNPFALHRQACEMLARALREQGEEPDPEVVRGAQELATYARETYGIRTGTAVERFAVSSTQPTG